ncbi:MAG: diguanylate cyclase [Myxococcota bacterium]
MTGHTDSQTSSPISALAVQIVSAAMQPDCSLPYVAGLIQSDPAFTVRVLSLVNSPLLLRRSKVTDIRRACAVLGVRGIRNLALNIAVTDMAPDTPEGRQLLACCLRRAVAIAQLAHAVHYPDESEVFTTGLLLELGLLSHARTDLSRAAALAASPALHRPTQERAEGWMAHPEKGARLAREYGMPQATALAIECHHQLEPPEDKLARLSWAAERLAAVFEGGPTHKLRAQAIEAGVHLALDEQIIEELLNSIPIKVEECARDFERTLRPQANLEDLIKDAAEELFQLNVQYEGAVRRLERLLEEKEVLATELRRANQVLKTMALSDALTKLPNKRALDETITREFERSRKRGLPLAVAMIDVDHFKAFNDTHGHQAGDLVLSSVAAALKDHLRKSDFPARFGGEEFCVIMPNTEAKEAARLAEEMREAIEAKVVDYHGEPLRVTASLGVTCDSRLAAENPEELIENADRALYAAKNAGRNRVEMAKS